MVRVRCAHLEIRSCLSRGRSEICPAGRTAWSSQEGLRGNQLSDPVPGPRATRLKVCGGRSGVSARREAEGCQTVNESRPVLA